MYYLYERSSTYIIGKDGRPDHLKSYKDMSAAKAAQTRLRKLWLATRDSWEANDPLFRYAIAESAFFHSKIEKTRTAKNLMSGAKFKEPVNTPGYMSPRSESYWSM